MCVAIDACACLCHVCVPPQHGISFLCFTYLNTEFHVRGSHGLVDSQLCTRTYLLALVRSFRKLSIVCIQVKALYPIMENSPLPNEKVVAVVEQAEKVAIDSSDDVVSMAPFKDHKHGNKCNVICIQFVCIYNYISK